VAENRRRGGTAEEQVRMIDRAIQNLGEVWRHLQDPRVMFRHKLIIAGALFYLVWPADLLPGLAFDDIVVLVGAAKVFLNLADQDIAKTVNQLP